MSREHILAVSKISTADDSRAIRPTQSAGAMPDQGAAPLVGTGEMVGLLPDAWAVARAEHEALKAIVEYERNPKPSRPLRPDEADAIRLLDNEAQPNAAYQPPEGEARRLAGDAG